MIILNQFYRSSIFFIDFVCLMIHIYFSASLSNTFIQNLIPCACLIPAIFWKFENKTLSRHKYIAFIKIFPNYCLQLYSTCCLASTQYFMEITLCMYMYYHYRDRSANTCQCMNVVFHLYLVWYTKEPFEVLTHYHTIPHFDALKIFSRGKHCEKRRNCL